MAKSFGAVLGRQLRTSEGKADSRRKLIMAVRAAARRLALSDDDRREIQRELTGKLSMGDMTLAELGKILDRLNRDWKGPMGHRSHVAKIRALWWTLYWIGAIDEPKGPALDAFVKRQTGISAHRFVDHAHASPIVEALKGWAAREGVCWPRAGETDPMGDRRAVTNAIWSKLADITALHAPDFGRAVAIGLGVPDDPAAWSARDWDAAICLLGKRLRRAMDKTAIE